MTRLIHLTDLHLSSLDACRLRDLRGKRWTGYVSWARKRRERHRREVLDGLAAAVRDEAADALLVSGDLVQIGLETEIREAAAWLAELAPAERILFVPGNHDVYARDSWAAIRRHWQPWLPVAAETPAAGYPIVRDAGGVTLLGASSACVTAPFSARGALGAGQLERVASALRSARDAGRLACLVIHHPPLRGMTAWRKSLREVVALQSLIASTRPALVVCGHLHRNAAFREGATRVFATASASSVQDASYRVFDLDHRAGGWQVRMQLKSAAPGTRNWLKCAEENWSIPD